MTDIVKSGSPSPDADAVRVLSGLVPEPHEYDMILPNRGKEPYVLMWRLLGAHINDEALHVGTEAYVRRNSDRIFKPARAWLYRLGWDVNVRITRPRKHAEREVHVSIVASTTRKPQVPETAWKGAPTPEQLAVLVNEKNEALTRMLWLFVQQIAEGHNVVELGREDTINTWAPAAALKQAKEIIVSRGWSLYALRSKPTKQNPHVRLCLKFVPKFAVDFGP